MGGKFARAMLGVLKVTQDNKKMVWKYIPLQDFTDKSDIDWSVSIANIDKQLYKKYRLSEEEIAFIENNVPAFFAPSLCAEKNCSSSWID